MVSTKLAFVGSILKFIKYLEEKATADISDFYNITKQLCKSLSVHDSP